MPDYGDDQKKNGRIVQSQNFINAARVASLVTAIVGPIIGGLVVYEVQRFNDRYDNIMSKQSTVETQIAVMAETQSAQAAQLISDSSQLRQLSDMINQTRDRVLCLEKHSICHD